MLERCWAESESIRKRGETVTLSVKVLLTGANGYIGLRLLPALLEAGHEVVCLVRDRRRFPEEDFQEVMAGPEARMQIIEADLLEPETLQAIPDDIDAAYYLVHSMGSGRRDFSDLESKSARNFAEAISKTRARQVIYLSGIVNEEEREELSQHLGSRRNVETLLREHGSVPVTVLRAAIIVGSGSASFEIIRDLVEKLPLMIAPRWLRTRCQPIAIRNVVDYLVGCLGHERTFDDTFDIGGPEVLTYQQLLGQFAEARGLSRRFIPVPLLSPKLSSYWLYFVTSTSFSLARSLVDSLEHDMVASDQRIQKIVPLDLLSYREAVERAFSRIAQNRVPSSWFDSLASGRMDVRFLDQVQVPQHGIFRDERRIPFDRDPEEIRENIWRIGGDRGWYAMDWAWRLRGWMDRVVGGAGLRRGRRHPTELRAGDALDFWRVLLADREKRRLMLFAEMKVPGEAWLEFAIEKNEADSSQPWALRQTATFRPRGLLGRAYWYAVLPMHAFVFEGMARSIVNRDDSSETN